MHILQYITALVIERAHAQVFDGGGLSSGLDIAAGITGIFTGDLPTLIQGALGRAVTFLALAATIVIVIAGFFLILGLGDEQSRDRAKRIILYTAIGMGVVVLATVIVEFFQFIIGAAPTTQTSAVVEGILGRALTFLALICVITIIIAGFFLILGLGDEQSRDRAKRIILYTAIGLIVIMIAREIVQVLFFIVTGGAEGTLRETVTNAVIRILSFLALIAVIVIVIAGIFLIVSGGDEQQKDRAKRIILYTIIGLLIIFFARLIVAFILLLGNK